MGHCAWALLPLLLSSGQLSNRLFTVSSVIHCEFPRQELCMKMPRALVPSTDSEEPMPMNDGPRKVLL